MAKVVLNGQIHFTRLAAEFLSSHTRDRFKPIDYRPFGRRNAAKYLVEIATARTVASFWGAVTVDDPFSRAMVLARGLGKPLVFMWMGTDVLWARERPHNEDLENGARHYCEAPWTRRELAEIGIEASLLPRPPMTRLPDITNVAPPETFSVLAYLGAGREPFYGYETIELLAREHQDVTFKIVGSSGVEGAPGNLQFLGRIAEERLGRLYSECAVFIRLPEHDGFSYSVREALAWGRTVIASYPYPHALHAPDAGAASDHLRVLREAFERGRFAANAAGREYIEIEYAPARVAHLLHAALLG